MLLTSVWGGELLIWKSEKTLNAAEEINPIHEEELTELEAQRPRYQVELPRGLFVLPFSMEG